VVGDWNADGKSEVGVYVGGNWYRDMDGSGTWDATNAAATLWFGGPWTNNPVVGNWQQSTGSSVVVAPVAPAAASAAAPAAAVPQNATGFASVVPAELLAMQVSATSAPGPSLDQPSPDAGALAALWSQPSLVETPRNTGEASGTPAVHPQAVDQMDLSAVVEHTSGRAGLEDLDATADLLGVPWPGGLHRTVSPADHDAAMAALAGHDWL
jgi:hypothetical protein